MNVINNRSFSTMWLGDSQCTVYRRVLFQMFFAGFPHGSLLKNPAASARERQLVQEDPTCQEAAKPVCRSDWACPLEPAFCNSRSHCTEDTAPQLDSSPHSPKLERSPCSYKDPAQPQ